MIQYTSEQYEQLLRERDMYLQGWRASERALTDYEWRLVDHERIAAALRAEIAMLRSQTAREPLWRRLMLRLR